MAEAGRQVDFCEHQGCGFEQRVEYCRNPDEFVRQDGLIVAELAARILYKHVGLLIDESFKLSSDLESSVARRNVTSISGFVVSDTCELEHIEMNLSHFVDDSEELFAVDIKQLAMGESADLSMDEGMTRYRLHFHDDEQITGVVTGPEWSMRENSRGISSRDTTRNMSQYDYLGLIDTLVHVYELRYDELEGSQHAQLTVWPTEGQE